ncbi:nucleoside-triphosphatase c1orf57, partial [Lynx pardinus]
MEALRGDRFERFLTSRVLPNTAKDCLLKIDSSVLHLNLGMLFSQQAGLKTSMCFITEVICCCCDRICLAPGGGWGQRGVGKTTLIQKASEVLKSSGVPIDGFYTEEVRQAGRRIGFDVVTLSGTRGVLSRIGSEPPPGKRECRVGQYVVDLTSFEQLALPVLRNAGPGSGPGQRVCVIDEIGKMELFSQPFIQAVRQTLSTPGTVVLGTIPVPKGKPLALVEEIRNRNDVQVFSVTKENRNRLLPDIVTCVQS